MNLKTDATSHLKLKNITLNYNYINTELKKSYHKSQQSSFYEQQITRQQKEYKIHSDLPLNVKENPNQLNMHFHKLLHHSFKQSTPLLLTWARNPCNLYLEQAHMRLLQLLRLFSLSTILVQLLHPNSLPLSFTFLS